MRNPRPSISWFALCSTSQKATSRRRTAMPGAVGAALAQNERPVVCIAGDGSAQYAIHALWTAANQRTPVTFGVLAELFCWRKDNFRLHRVGNEALLVRQMMKAAFIGRRRQLASTILDCWTELYPADPWDAGLVFRHRSDGLVLIRIDLKSFPRGHVKKCEHMAARNGGHKRLFRIDASRVRVRNRYDVRRWRSGHREPAVKGPDVLARILPAQKPITGPLPTNCCRVFSHLRNPTMRRELGQCSWGDLRW
jgi:hypothetical protein